MTDNSLHQNSSQSSSKPQNGIKGTLIEPTADRPFTSVRFGPPKPAAPAKKAEAKAEQPQNGVKGVLVEPTAERPFVSVRFGAAQASQAPVAEAVPVAEKIATEHLSTVVEAAPGGGVNIKVFFRYNGSDCVASLYHPGCVSSGD